MDLMDYIIQLINLALMSLAAYHLHKTTNKVAKKLNKRFWLP